jgi:hypothetical protein
MVSNSFFLKKLLKIKPKIKEIKAVKENIPKFSLYIKATIVGKINMIPLNCSIIPK